MAPRHALPEDPRDEHQPGAGIIRVPESYLLREEAAPPRTLVDIVRTTAGLYPDAAAIDDGEVLTYAELLADATAWAAELSAQGIGRGHRIGVRMTSGK